MTVVLVAMAVDASARSSELTDLAAAIGARHAFLQQGSPSLGEVLDDLVDEPEVVLVPAPSSGTTAPARSWLTRQAAHWSRTNPGGPQLRVGGREISGTEAPLESPAWEDVPGHRHHVLVCRGPRCAAKGGGATAAALDERLRERGLGDDDVLVVQAGCLFPCNHAPVVVVHPADAWFGPVDADGAAELADSLADGRDPGLKRLRRDNHKM